MKKGFMKICGLALSLALMTVCASILVGCGHEHTFAAEWKSDSTNHWHAATCEHMEEVSDKAAHTFGGDKCTVCGYTKQHEHTFAAAWSSDETNHWHAATCEHTAEKKDSAAHVFDGTKCTVGDYEKAAKCKCAEPCEVCPECGGCIEADCAEATCIKCGDGLTSHEYFAYQAKLSPGRNPADPSEKWNFTCVDHTQCSDGHKHIRDNTSSGGFVVQSVQGNNGGAITFEIVASKECVATLRIDSAKNATKPYFTDQMMLLINGEIVDAKAGPGERDSAIKSNKEDYGYFIFGCIPLIEGKNTIVIQTVTGDPAVGYNICGIDVMTASDVTLEFTPTTNNLVVCDD